LSPEEEEAHLHLLCCWCGLLHQGLSAETWVACTCRPAWCVQTWEVVPHCIPQRSLTPEEERPSQLVWRLLHYCSLQFRPIQVRGLTLEALGGPVEATGGSAGPEGVIPSTIFRGVPPSSLPTLLIFYLYYTGLSSHTWAWRFSGPLLSPYVPPLPYS